MHVAWDLQAVTGPRPTGLGRFVHLLLDALQAQPHGITITGLRPNQTDAPLLGTLDRLNWEQLRLPAALRRLRGTAAPQLLYSPALGAPLYAPVPVVAHVNDVIPLTHPGQFRRLSRWYWESYLPITWKRALLLTTSNTAMRHEIATRLHYPPERIAIVPLYPDTALAARAAELRDAAQAGGGNTSAPRFCMVGVHEPRKNIALALRALQLLKQRGLRAELVCAGSTTPHTAELQQLAAELGVEQQVSFPGYASTETVAALYATCTALLFVSRLEGYGMPPQEAQGAGCPVILSDIPCLRAVYGDPLRWQALPADQRESPPFIHVDDCQGLADAMWHVAEDAAYRARLVQAGLSYQTGFSPAATALALATAFELAIG